MGKRAKVVSKKAWHKIDVAEVEAAAVAPSRALLRDSAPEHKENKELFFVDKKGNAARRGRREPWELKSSQILKPNDKVPVIPRQTGGRKASCTEAAKIERIIARDGERKSKYTAQRSESADRVFDLWDDKEQEASQDVKAWPVAYKNDPLLLDSAIPATGYISNTKKRLASRLRPEPSKYRAVEVAHPGASYRPQEGEHKALIGKVAAHIVLEEARQQQLQDRLGGKLDFKLLRQAPEIGRDDVEEPADEDGDEGEQGLLQDATPDGSQHVVKGKVVSGPSGRKVQPGVKLSKTERNKMERHKERERLLKEAKELKKRDRQLNRLEELSQEVDRSLQAQEEAARLREDLKEEVERNRVKRLGKHKLKEDLPAVLLPEELPSGLRRLKPETKPLTEQFKMLQKRNLIEPRLKRTFKRGQLANKKLKLVTQRAYIDL